MGGGGRSWGQTGTDRDISKGWLQLPSRERATGICVRSKSSVCIICYSHCVLSTLLSHTCGLIHKHSCDLCAHSHAAAPGVSCPAQRVNEADGLREVERELRERRGREGGSVTVSSCLPDLPDFPLSMNQCRLSLSHYSYEASGLPRAAPCMAIEKQNGERKKACV